jgi:hypothetical protein
MGAALDHALSLGLPACAGPVGSAMMEECLDLAEAQKRTYQLMFQVTLNHKPVTRFSLNLTPY